MCKVEKLEEGRCVADEWRIGAWVVPSRVEWGCAVAHIIHCTITKDSEQ